MARRLESVRRTLTRPAGRLFLAVLAVLLVSWPLLSPGLGWTCRYLYGFLFAAWFLVVLLLVAIGFSMPRSDRPGTGSPP